jgi:hypothetical protein
LSGKVLLTLRKAIRDIQLELKKVSQYQALNHQSVLNPFLPKFSMEVLALMIKLAINESINQVF